ncbi:MAG: ABC-ATPase domain-containing protein [Alphaproteobacteria bacterium]|nr:ABC-ATPase domain-containing protein [Alphaproteobacteria bacterium]
MPAPPSRPSLPGIDALRALCQRIDGRPYGAWKDLQGAWDLGDAVMRVDHVQGDPFAAPSRVRLRVPVGDRLDPALWSDAAGRVACEDFLLRAAGDAVARTAQRRGSGRSGALEVYRPGPEILRRSGLVLTDGGRAELRLTVGLPAQGRRVLGRQGHELLAQDLVAVAVALRESAGRDALARQVASVRRQRALRDQLDAAGLVAFIEDGSVLPRASGVSQAPLADAVPVRAPDGLAVELRGPDGPVRGLGIERGITLLCGGGFHGKSTVLQALQRGHLDHVPGDGREGVVALPDTVKIRAEDGRAVRSVDISAFLGALPGGRDTRAFSTDDASGSTSQAAALVEAVEAGARVLLLDEDTSATNLLVRDERMRVLVPDAHEPIVPLVQRLPELVARWDLSVVVVAGGVGAFLDVADRVVGLRAFHVIDLGAEARALARPPSASPRPLPARRVRRVALRSLRPERERVRARDGRRLDYGGAEIDLSAVEQVLDGAHARSLGQALSRAAAELAGAPTVTELLDHVDRLMIDQGPDALSPWSEPVGDLIELRRHDVAAALNRLRDLDAEVQDGGP